MKRISLLLVAAATTTLVGCAATESRQVIQTPAPSYASVSPSQNRVSVIVGNFQNRSNYLRGVFSGNTDTLGNQAKTVLQAHLRQSNQFNVGDRDNLAQLEKEAGYANSAVNIQGARYVITGDVTEFGRKNVGDKQLFGILGKGKTQVAYSKVTLNVLDTQTANIVYSVTGAGEYALSTREVVGFGSDASYDATLNGKVLDLAISEAVSNLVTGVKQGAWASN